jgi:hypothetical protein
MRKYLEKVLCLIFNHKWVYQYRRVARGKLMDQEYYIHQCVYCEKIKEFKK